MKAYYMSLKDLNNEAFERAIMIVLQDRKYNKMPMPAEIRQAVLPDLDERAILAYDAFTKGKAQTGKNDSVCFEDKIIHAVIMAMGGWASDYGVFMITEDEWKFKRREFIDLYKAIAHQSGREMPDKLIGLGEHGCSQNEEWARHMPPLKMISYTGEIKEVRNQLLYNEKKQELLSIAGGKRG